MLRGYIQRKRERERGREGEREREGTKQQRQKKRERERENTTQEREREREKERERHLKTKKVPLMSKRPGLQTNMEQKRHSPPNERRRIPSRPTRPLACCTDMENPKSQGLLWTGGTSFIWVGW